MQGKISIVRMRSADEDGCIAITVNDAETGIEFLDLRLSLATFASALTGLGHQSCTFTVRGLQHLGKRLETKEERVAYAHRYAKDIKGLAAAKAAALAPYEVDGWVGRPSDLGHIHRGDDQRGYMVLFSRYVPSSEESYTPSTKGPNNGECL